MCSDWIILFPPQLKHVPFSSNLVSFVGKMALTTVSISLSHTGLARAASSRSLTFLFSPVINLLGLLNKQMELPAFMAPIEEWMRAQETLAEQLTTILLSSDSVWVILANLIVIAVTAGITEEFLFRGALQRVIGKWTSNPHTIIWIAAILFSAFHLQFYGFLPRMILGAYFGYLLYWSKSIWIPVFAHFVNNAFAVIGMSDSRLKDNEFVTGDIPAEHLLDFCLIAALSFLLFILVNRRLKRLL